MKRKIFFQSSKGHKLCGILSDPSGDNRRPLIVLCHGFTTSKDGRTYLGLLIARGHDIDVEAWRQEGYLKVEGADGKNLRLNYSFFVDAERIQGYTLAERIKAPTLIVHGDRDETVPLAQSQKAADLIPNCRLEVIKGADHTYSYPQHFECMLDLISDFVVSMGALEDQPNE